MVVGESRQLSTRPSGCWNGSRQESATCTLLGPEGPGLEGDLETRFLGPRSDRLDSTLRSRRQERYRPYVENYTVDASILELRPSGLGSTINASKEALDHWSAAGAFGRRQPIDSNSCSQVSKSKRWMPWHLEPKKDVAICDKPRGADKRAVSRGFPNGETPLGVLVRPSDSRLNI